MKIYYCIAIVLLIPSTTFALTPLAEKNVPIDRSEELVREAPSWFQPVDLQVAPKNIEYRMNILPFPEDRNTSSQYIVVPTLGLIAPVQFGDTDDQKLFKEGKEVNIDTYLKHGIMYYHGTAELGSPGNAVYFGHSNYVASDTGRYKTIFGNIMALDPAIDEVRFYVRHGTNTKYQRFVYVVSESYETTPSDVAVILPKFGTETTLIACTDGLNGRRIIRGQHKPGHYEAMSNAWFIKTKHMTTQVHKANITQKQNMVIEYLAARDQHKKISKNTHPNTIHQKKRTQLTLEELYVKKQISLL